MFLDIFAALFPIFGVIFLGMLVARKALLPADTAVCLNKFVYWIALPALLLNYLSRVDVTQISSGFFAAIAISSMGSYLLCFAITTKFFRQITPMSAMLTFLSCFPNVGFMCVGIVEFLLPGNSAAMLTISICAIIYMPVMLYTDTKLEMNKHKGENKVQALRSLGLTLVRAPMIIAVLLGVCLSLLGVKMPRPMLNVVAMLGGTAAPCALFCMGMMLNAQLASASKFPANWALRHLPVHLVKLILLPLFTYLALDFFGVSGITLGVATLAACMPSGIAANVVAEKFQVAVHDTSICIVVSTALSIVTIPTVIFLMYKLGAL